MTFDQKKGTRRLTAPRPQKTVALSSVEPVTLKEANLLEQHEEYTASSAETEAPQDKKSGLKLNRLSLLTDVPALRDYFSRIGAEPRSLKTAVVKEQAAKYERDLAVIRVSPTGEIETPAEYAPTESEAAAIKVDCAGFVWPKPVTLEAISNPPEMIRTADKRHIFEFRDAENRIAMIQVRTEDEKRRAYVPWTFWDDGEWRCCEPDGPLPIYNADRIKETETVFIHEGAKAARYIQRLVDGKTREDRDLLKAHPWGAEMTGAVHLGWIGGALSPGRTDWDALRKAGVKRAFIVADNDEPGRSAVPKIAKALNFTTYVVQFGDEFPASFDLADEFPRTEEMFDKDGNYKGPSFNNCREPATWMTDQYQNPDGKGSVTTVLREHAKNIWAYIEEIDAFVCRDAPGIIRNESVLNKMLAPFSHVAETSRLLIKAYQGRSVKLCYRPDKTGLSINVGGSPAINIHVPPGIASKSGDPKTFLDFLAYLFPNERERNEVERWCATLIARPDVRIGYGLLLISEKQGIGKTTLGSAILAPLIGRENVSFPNQKSFESAFNGWIANKRLAIVNEIYCGASWKVYMNLKTIITDEEVEVNQKYQRSYTTDNWVHIFACSNSRRALKVEDGDRRWLVPEVTEKPWPRQRFKELREWLLGGGLEVIQNWAETYGNYIEPGERAPETNVKADMIAGSRSEAQNEAVAFAEALIEIDKFPAALVFKHVVDTIKARVNGKVYDSDYEIRRAMTERGVRVLPERVKIKTRREYVLINKMLEDELAQIPTETAKAARIRDLVKTPAEILPADL
jgi:hypothetical protein